MAKVQAPQGAKRQLDTMRAPELAARLGMSLRGIRAAGDRGEIPGIIRIGRTVHFSRKVIDRWLSGDLDPDTPQVPVASDAEGAA